MFGYWMPWWDGNTYKDLPCVYSLVQSHFELKVPEDWSLKEHQDSFTFQLLNLRTFINMILMNSINFYCCFPKTFVKVLSVIKLI